MDCGADVNVLHEYEHFSAFYFMVERVHTHTNVVLATETYLAQNPTSNVVSKRQYLNPC